MKKIIVSGFVLGALIASSQFAMAANGTITINGMVTSSTCDISSSGGGKDFTVTLPTVATSALAAAGQTAGRTPFSIMLANCTPGAGNVHTFFEPGATTDASTGNLVVAGGGAANVQIGLLNSDLTPIKAGFDDASQNSHIVALNSGSAELPYYAEYHATGAATAGPAVTSVMYTISYN
jgi:major type 1 subunit fimbrin (pilin)